MSKLVVGPYEQSRYIGTLCQVHPSRVVLNLPLATTPSGAHFAGYPIPGGQVGEFVVVEGEQHAVLARIVNVRLPERDRLSVEPASKEEYAPNPVGEAQLLTAVDLESGKPLGGIPVHPRVGQHVFSAHPKLVKQVVEASEGLQESKVHLARFPHSQSTIVSFPPAHIFGRHCAVLGATGGGKSWTVARLVEEIRRLGGKAILFDASGEYGALTQGIEHVYLGGSKQGENDDNRYVSFPYTRFSESDFFALFRPSASAQAPKLRDAIISLKLAYLDPDFSRDGVVPKERRPKRPYDQALARHAEALAEPDAYFEIKNLADQVHAECVWPPREGQANWGNINDTTLGYCTTLISRISADVASQHMECIFKPENYGESLPEVIDDFLNNRESSVLRVSMENVPFEHSTRELVVNAIGRHLLTLARQGRFKSLPLVTLLDEAHQFLDKTIGDEFSRTSLDAFGLIAKEGRKYSLSCVLATQRPRDIPEDVLSQMGMFIVHRLINDRDRSVVERACGQLDASAASFLPTLGQGEAIVVGIESPMPLPVQIFEPRQQPESRGADYEEFWAI